MVSPISNTWLAFSRRGFTITNHPPINSNLIVTPVSVLYMSDNPFKPDWSIPDGTIKDQSRSNERSRSILFIGVSIGDFTRHQTWLAYVQGFPWIILDANYCNIDWSIILFAILHTCHRGTTILQVIIKSLKLSIIEQKHWLDGGPSRRIHISQVLSIYTIMRLQVIIKSLKLSSTKQRQCLDKGKAAMGHQKDADFMTQSEVICNRYPRFSHSAAV